MYENLSFDQIKAGDRFPLGQFPMTRDEVIAFAAKYDPQPFHLDDAAARENPLFTGLSASGWHAVLAMNLMLDRFWKKTRMRGLAGSGVENIRWLRPVYPGDVLTGEVEIVAARHSVSKPERGVMTMLVRLHNQTGEQVTQMSITGIFAR